MDVLPTLVAALLWSLIANYSKQIGPVVVRWLSRRRREAVAVTIGTAGLLCLIASGQLLEGWWEALSLEIGAALVLVGIVDLLILSAMNDPPSKA